MRAVEASRLASWRDQFTVLPGDGDGWIVGVWAMEFIRSDPPESELRQRIMNALQGVSGVTHVEEHDREQWFLTGTLSGPALVAAVAQVVDELAARIRWGLLDGP